MSETNKLRKMQRAHITPLLITYNEEANLPRVLAKLRWASRIVVIDSFSTDATLDILAGHPQVDVFQRPFDSFAGQCNYGLSQIRSEWVLSMDADYVLTDAFVDEIDEIDTLDGDADGYRARFIYCVNGIGLRASLYPPRTVLYRRSKGRYVVDGHAHKLHVDGAIASMDSKILHDDRKPLAAWLDAQKRYAAQEAEKLKRGRDLGFVDRIRKRRWFAPMLTLLYCLFRKGLILDGSAGWHYTAQRTYAELLLTLHLCADADAATERTHVHPKRNTLSSRAA